MKYFFFLLVLIVVSISCNTAQDSNNQQLTSSFDWDAANVYFLLTDRFYNGDTANDTLVNRDVETGPLRGFQGGDFAGIQEKIEEGYFTDLGINAIWLTPIFQQVEGGVDEGTGFTYAYHGYWTKDWTAVEPSFGTLEEFKELVQAAHNKDIRILLDVVINHTGPVTAQDPLWPQNWVRTGPTCTYQDQETAVSCTLTNNLPDVLTNSTQEVNLPPHLVEKWKEEGRYNQEVQELNAFFNTSGLARTPVNYIIKWVTDYARETGVDGFRVDTVKHVEEEVWTTFIEQSKIAYNDWKKNNPEDVIHEDEFFILGELYGYYAEGGRGYYFNDKVVDYFESGFDSMINFGFKEHAQSSYETLFEGYDMIRDSLRLEDKDDPATFMNYISSHDDGQPFDPQRKNTITAGTKLLLTPGQSQVYYGDETGRLLEATGAVGDANLRTMMNWDQIDTATLQHWQQLGKFRRDHPAVGAGSLYKLAHQGKGYVNARFYDNNGFKDDVIIGVGLLDGPVDIDISKVFKNENQLRNAYTNQILPVNDGKVRANARNGVVLLEMIQ